MASAAARPAAIRLWPGWPSYTRVRSAGCYLYQVDGTSFSELIVFQAVGGV